MMLGLKVRGDKQAGSNKLLLFFFLFFSQKRVGMRAGYIILVSDMTSMILI